MVEGREFEWILLKEDSAVVKNLELGPKPSRMADELEIFFGRGGRRNRCTPASGLH